MTEPSEPAPASAADQPAAPAASKRRKSMWIWGAVALVVIIGAAIAIPVSIANAEAAEKAAAEQAAAEAERERLAAFADAFQVCRTPASEYLEILDGGEALSLRAVGKLYGPAYDDLVCLLGQLDAPSALESKIGATRALDGAQKDEWPGYKIEWRYHPDDGATVLIEHAT